MLALGLGLLGALVVAGDVANAELGHAAIAVLHLAHRPLQGDDRLLRIGDDGRQQVRDAVIDRQLQHLGVDHDEAAFGRRQAIEDRQDHGVDPDRLARARGASDQEVGHARQIGDIGVAADGLAERQRQDVGRLAVFGRGQEVPQIDGLTLQVRQFDADGVAVRHDRDAAGAGGHGAGDIVAEGHDPAVLHARRRHQFVEGDHGAWTDLVDHALDPELGQDAFQHLGVLLQGVLVDHAAARLGLGQHAQRRQVEIALRTGEVEHGLVVVDGLLGGLGRLGRGDLDLGCGRERRCGRSCIGRGVDRLVPGQGLVGLDLGLRLVIGGQFQLGRATWGAGGRGLGFRLGAGRATADGLGRGRLRLTTQARGPGGALGEIAQAQTHGVSAGPQAKAEEQQAADDVSARHMQGPEARIHQTDHRIAPKAAETGSQRPGAGRREGRQGGGQAEHAAGRRQRLQRRGLQALLDRVADGGGQAEGDRQGRGRPGGEAQGLHEDVGEQGAVQAQPVGRGGRGRGVQAGVRRVPRHQGHDQQRRQQGLQHAPEPHHEGCVPDHEGAQESALADGEGCGHRRLRTKVGPSVAGAGLKGCLPRGGGSRA